MQYDINANRAICNKRVANYVDVCKYAHVATQERTMPDNADLIEKLRRMAEHAPVCARAAKVIAAQDAALARAGKDNIGSTYHRVRHD